MRFALGIKFKYYLKPKQAYHFAYWLFIINRSNQYYHNLFTIQCYLILFLCSLKLIQSQFINRLCFIFYLLLYFNPFLIIIFLLKVHYLIFNLLIFLHFVYLPLNYHLFYCHHFDYLVDHY